MFTGLVGRKASHTYGAHSLGVDADSSNTLLAISDTRVLVNRSRRVKDSHRFHELGKRSGTKILHELSVWKFRDFPDRTKKVLSSLRRGVASRVREALPLTFYGTVPERAKVKE